MVTSTAVSLADARRIAIRAQLLDGSARGVLQTIEQLGFLQIDTVRATEAPQYLVLWSRLGAYDRSELDRLLWEQRKLFEWRAFIYPMSDLPLIRSRMRRFVRSGRTARDVKIRHWLRVNARFRAYVTRELERRGPVLSRDLEDRSVEPWRTGGWNDAKNVTLMLELMWGAGEIAVVGRRGGQRLWDLAERWYPETDVIPPGEADRILADKRFRALGLSYDDGRLDVHPNWQEPGRGTPARRTTLLSPFDRLIYDRERAEALFGFRYRLEMYVPQAKREYGYYVLPILHGERLVGRIDPLLDRKAGVLRIRSVHWEPGAPKNVPLKRTVGELAAWLGAADVEWP